MGSRFIRTEHLPYHTYPCGFCCSGCCIYRNTQTGPGVFGSPHRKRGSQRNNSQLNCAQLSLCFSPFFLSVRGCLPLPVILVSFVPAFVIDSVNCPVSSVPLSFHRVRPASAFESSPCCHPPTRPGRCARWPPSHREPPPALPQSPALLCAPPHRSVAAI